MSVFAAIIIIVCGLVLFIKWIVFILLSPFIIFIHKRKRKQSILIEENDKIAIQNICHNYTEVFVHHSTSLKSVCRRYLDGFIRYMQLQTSYIPSHHIRKFIYRHIYLVTMERNSILYYGAEIRGAYNLKIGKGSIIGDKSVLDARRGGITIGENVQLGSFVKLWTGSHDHDDPYFRSMPGKRGPIYIGDRAWLGPNVTVLHSVSIGEGAVVAAGAIVTKDVEPYSIVGGIPAKKIGERSRNLKYNFTGNYIPFF